MHSKEGRHICEAVGKRPNKNLQRFRLQLQHKFVLSVRNKQNSFKYVIQLVRVWKRGIRCCVGKPASKSQIDFTHRHFGHFSYLLQYMYISKLYFHMYIYILNHKSCLHVMVHLTPGNKRKKVHLRIHESAWLCGDTLPASTRNNNKPHTYSQPGCFDQFHHTLCPSTQSEVENWIYSSWKMSKQPISVVSLTINAIIQYRSGLGRC